MLDSVSRRPDNFARVNCVRKAKIVCTLGPASSTPERLAELVAAGMDVARLNMSHGDYVDHLRNLRSVREAAEAAGRPVGVLADLQGPKIRLGRFANGKVRLHVGDALLALTCSPRSGSAGTSATTKGSISPALLSACQR